MKKLICFLFICFLVNNLSAQVQYLNNESETEDLSKIVSELFVANKISEAFETLVPHWPMPQNELEAIEDKTLKFMNILEQRFGSSIDAKKIKNETISDFAIRETYVVRFKHSAIRLIFSYYKNDEGWILNAFKWDDSFTDEFSPN